MTYFGKSRLLRTSALCRAVAVALVAAPAAFVALPQVATAQDYTNGTLTGVVQDTAGQPVAGAEITVRSASQGVTRTTTSGPDGRFRIPLIPTGRYAVAIEPEGRAASSHEVSVGLGGASDFTFTVESTASDSASTIEDVVVTGVRRNLDFARTATGVTVDVEELIDQVPISRNITAVTLLAPGAVAGDAAFAVGSAQLQSPPSLSGASPAENVFFVNGLNITNFVNGLGGAPVPFEFYKTVEVKTGGYSAEFGRATGGAVNAVTKSGTNDFVLELHGTWAPDSLREDSPNTVPFPNVAGAINELSQFEESTLSLELGGPIIRDRLFAYGLVSWKDTTAASAATDGIYSEDAFSKDPFYGVKIDGYLTDAHRLEFTYFNTESERTRTNYRFDPTTYEIDRVNNITQSWLRQGGDNWVARYTGSLTDWLTVSAAYGESNVDQQNTSSIDDEPRVLDQRPGQGGRQVSRQSNNANNVPFFAERRFYRADADVYFDLLGEHHVRLGFDHEDTKLTQFSVRNGGYNVTYLRAVAGNSLGLAAGQDYITTRIFKSGGGFEGANEALYIQDSWDVNDRLNLSLGLRLDTFEISNPLGQTFVNFDGELGPRLGFAFDPTGDGSSKFYGSYGRYYLPPASNTAFRMASPAIDITEFFRPVGGGLTLGALDPVTGLPVGGFGPQITAATGATSLQSCPANTGTTAPAGTVACSVRNNGVAALPEEISALNLQSTYEDEWRIGYETRLDDFWSVGVNATYRNLGRVVEDALIDQGILAYCEREGIAGCDALYPGQRLYLIINPGFDVEASVVLPGSPTPRTITLTAEDLGLPKAKREYTALEFTFARAFDGVWGLQGSYVLSRSQGNYEGAVKSDIGQTDAGIVQDFDFLSFIPGAYGLLPNHRGHQFKVFGSWQARDNLLIGGNLSVTSPRPYGCLGLAPADYANGDGRVANDSYGASARFCKGVVVDRGSVFESDWATRFDLSLRYSLDDLVPGNLVLRADIFNVFNLKSVIQNNEFGEDDAGNPVDTYQGPTAYQAPRSIRLGFDWAF